MNSSKSSSSHFVALTGYLVMIIFGLIVGLLMAEVTVRVLGIAPQIAVLEKGRFRLSQFGDIAYERVPNLDYSGQSLAFYDFRGKGNSLGFRSPEYGVEKPAGTQRIVVVGDSIGEGHRVPDEAHIFARRMEKVLQDSGRSIEVLNFSVSGYNTQQEVATLREKALVYDPDLVILQYCLNDNNSLYPGILNPLLDQLKDHQNVVSHLASETNRKLVGSALYRFVKFNYFAEQQTLESDLLYERHKKYYSNKKSVEQSLVELSQLSSQHGFQVLVLVFPKFDPSDIRYENYRHQDQHTWISNLSESQNLKVHDLLPALRRCASEAREPRALFADSLHPTAEGHACVTASIIAYLQATKLLDQL